MLLQDVFGPPHDHPNVSEASTLTFLASMFFSLKEKPWQLTNRTALYGQRSYVVGSYAE